MIGFALKISGVGLVIGGAGLFGKQYGRHLSRRVAIIEATLKTLRMIREKILHENELLEVCMASCGKMYPLPEGNLFEGFAGCIDEGKDTVQHWKNYVTQYFTKNGIHDTTLLQGLCDLGEAFVQVSTDSLISSIDATCALLSDELIEAEERKKKEGALAWKISLAVGVLLAVVLY